MQGFARASALAVTLALAATTAAYADTVDPGAEALGRSLASQDGLVTGARFVTTPPTAGATALGTTALAGFPTSGADYALLTTGDASIAGSSDSSESSGRDLGGAPQRGNTDFDVTIIEIDLNVPANTNCLVGMDFRFLSEEFSEYVNSAYNDAFIAEVDSSTWTTSGSTINAPRNFAFDPEGNPISINAAGVTSMKEEFAAGTTYDGATPILSAATPISPGAHKLYLSIFDQGDPVYDSAVMVDNVRFGRVADVARDCRPGAELADASNHVMLGDSYSSGFGNGDYAPGTHKDAGDNDCQRSSHAFGPLVAVALDLEPSNHACQGAVTKDFYAPRNSTWGEPAQLDWLDPETGLVTFSIGGNDAHFADVVAECALGMELLPFNTCHNDDKVTEPIAEAFARLDNQRATPAETTPYDTLYKDVRRRSPFATHVVMGYPPFFTPDGSDRTFLPGGRCELIKKVDQAWMTAKVAEFNAMIRRNAERNGFRFADPTSRFLGHELCGEDDEWFYDALNAGKFHPTIPGQAAMSQAILEKLLNDDAPRFEVHPGQTAEYQLVIDKLLDWLSTIISWPGSDVELTLISPSGKQYTRAAPGAGVKHENGPTWEQFEIPNPEQGTWTVKMYGADVKPQGEEVRLSVVQQEPANKPPVAKIKWAKVGDEITLDASGSTDADGTIASYDWYLNTSEGEKTASGPSFTFPRPEQPQSVTLMVRDNDGATAFATVSSLPMDVLPGKRLNPIVASQNVPLQVSIMSTADFDASTLDTSTLRLGRGGARVMKVAGVTKADLNHDNKKDLLLLFAQADVGLQKGDTSVCMTGTLPDTQEFTSCDEIRTL